MSAWGIADKAMFRPRDGQRAFSDMTDRDLQIIVYDPANGPDGATPSNRRAAQAELIHRAKPPANEPA